MQIKTYFPLWGMSIYHFLSLAWLMRLFAIISGARGSPTTAILLNANPVHVKRLMYQPFRVVNKRRSPPFYDQPPASRSDEYYYDSPHGFSDSDAFPIEVDDAVIDSKFSPPVAEDHSLEHHASIPLSYPSHREPFIPNLYSSTTGLRRPTVEYAYPVKTSTSYPVTRGYKRLNPRPPRDSMVVETTVTSDYKVRESLPALHNKPTKDDRQPMSVLVPSHIPRNNFTENNDSQISAPSDTVLQYQPPIGDGHASNDERHLNNKHLQNRSPFIPTTEVSLLDSETLLKDNQQVPTYLGPNPNTSVQITTKKVIVDFFENSTFTTPDSFDVKENISDIFTPLENIDGDKISSGAFAGIIIGILSGVTVFTSSVIYLLYRKFNGKCTSIVENKFNSDNCGYLDDSLRSSVYLNNHIELPKENSEEMTSLDNDSFLNSLETMTIQNYWADSTKNTKV